MGNLKVGKFYITSRDILEMLDLGKNSHIQYQIDNSGVNITIITDEDKEGFVNYINGHEYRRQPVDVKLGSK